MSNTPRGNAAETFSGLSLHHVQRMVKLDALTRGNSNPLEKNPAQPRQSVPSLSDVLRTCTLSSRPLKLPTLLLSPPSWPNIGRLDITTSHQPYIQGIILIEVEAFGHGNGALDWFYYKIMVPLLVVISWYPAIVSRPQAVHGAESKYFLSANTVNALLHHTHRTSSALEC